VTITAGNADTNKYHLQPTLGTINKPMATTTIPPIAKKTCEQSFEVKYSEIAK
jgi:hypothetical protein